MRIKVEKHNVYGLQEEIYKLLNLDLNKNYKFLPDFSILLNLLNNYFKYYSKDYYYLKFEETYEKFLIIEDENGKELYRRDFTFVKLN